MSKRGDLAFLPPDRKASKLTSRVNSGQHEVPYRHINIRRREAPDRKSSERTSGVNFGVIKLVRTEGRNAMLR